MNNNKLTIIFLIITFIITFIITKSSTSQPWTYCGTEEDILTIKKVNINPIPAIKGGDISGSIEGNLKEEIEGASVEIKVKVGYVTFFHKVLDLCELSSSSNSSITCPLPAGDFKLTTPEGTKIPDYAPTGEYTGFLKIYTEFGEPITCLNFKFKILESQNQNQNKQVIKKKQINNFENNVMNNVVEVLKYKLFRGF